MLRLCLCLLLTLASATVAAREVKMSSPNSGACPDAHIGVSAGTDAIDAAPTAARAATPRETKIKPSVHSDVPSRLSSPRWHSFLPGMFR